MSLSVKVIVDSCSVEHAQHVEQILQQARIDVELIREPANCSQAPACRWLDPSCVNKEGRMAGALLDAVDTIEDTRHAFKSKQLGALRKRLQQVLDSLPDD